jgi:hypothetical protein
VVTCTGDASLAPGADSAPITLHTTVADKESCELVNVAAVRGGGDDGVGYGRGGDHDDLGINLTKDVLDLPCHRAEGAGGVTVNVNVTGNNNGGHGGDSSGATANDNGHIHGITGGTAKADADAKAKTDAKAKAHAQVKVQVKAPVKAHVQVKAHSSPSTPRRTSDHSKHPARPSRHFRKGCRPRGV